MLRYISSLQADRSNLYTESMKKYGGYVYLLTNKQHTVLYVGVTENVVKRVWQHKEKFVEGFTKRYNISKLVYYEEYSTLLEAIAREKQIKNWKREWKIDLIKTMNPEFRDLYYKLLV